MKKTLIVFVIILVGLFVFISYADRKGDYAVEKELWKVSKRFVAVTKDPKAVPDAEYDDIVKGYEKFIQRFPSSKLIPRARVLIGKVYMIKADYKKAREVFEGIIRDYPRDARVGALALMEIGKTYALEKDEKNILATYKRSLAEYPLTDFGLGAPLVIIKFYADKGQKEESEKAFNEAVKHYKKLITEHEDPIGFNAKRLLAACYMSKEKWGESLDVFSELFLNSADQKYMTPQVANSILKAINTISIVKLNSVDRPIEIYSSFIEKYPKHPFNKVLTSMITAFKELKQKVENGNQGSGKVDKKSNENIFDKE